MFNSIKRYTFLLIGCVNLCLASPQHQYHNVKGGQQLDTGVPVKSYGGYFHDSTSTNQLQPMNYHSYNQQIQQPILPFPFLEFNYFQPQHHQQVVRTYGGVVNNKANPNNQIPHNQIPNNYQNFGWFGFGFPQDQGQTAQDAHTNKNAAHPPTFMPNFSPYGYGLPNYGPNFYNPSNLPFPNFNLFPFGLNNAVGFHPPTIPHQPVNPPMEFQTTTHSPARGPSSTESTFQIRVTTPRTTTVQPEIDVPVDSFPTDSLFFETSSPGHRQQWTNEKEREWHATTKAPYFENKVPGKECPLPAAAVLGATSALKVSSLLPLVVPVGRPILSCNATELHQAIISLDGTLYNCHRSSITLSCPRVTARYGFEDRCLGKTLECDDVPHRSSNDEVSRKVSCTNGTLISDHSITCKSAHLTQANNILNCVFTNGMDNNDVLPPIHVTDKPEHTKSPVSENNNINEVDLFDVRISGSDSAMPVDLQKTLYKVFPSNLLSSIPSQKLSLPLDNSLKAKSENHKIPESLKNNLDKVFPHKLFALSQLSEPPQELSQRLSTIGQRRTTKIPFYVRVDDDDDDRHIFSS